MGKCGGTRKVSCKISIKEDDKDLYYNVTKDYECLHCNLMKDDEWLLRD